MMNIASRDIIVESLVEMSLDQPPADRRHYVEEVLESSINAAGNAKLIEKLYQDIMKSSEIDFGKIDDSKGDLTKYKYYEPMSRSIEILNDLAKGANGSISVLDTMNKIHTILLEGRDDFVFGYKFSVDLIKYIYEILVMTLYELIDCGISEVADYLKNTSQITIGTNNKRIIKRSNRVISNANKFIKSYETGQWSIVMKSFKKNSSQLLGGMEAALGGSAIATFLAQGSVGIIGAIIGIFAAIRGLVFVFYYGKTKISDYAKNQAELIKANIAADADQSSNAIEKQRKMATRLEKIADRLNGVKRRRDAEVDKAIVASNKTDYTKTELTASNSIMDDFELV